MKLTLRQMIDLPPVWLVAFILLAALQSRVLPLGGAPTLVWWLGMILMGAGFVLIFLGLRQLTRQGTTPIPHMTPSRIVTTGIFALTRNPIYLADVLILTGISLQMGAWPSLILVPLLVWVLQHRFILPEEERMRTSYGEEFESYAARTRRWI